jgi:SAM-dependent methyltransferase
MFTDQIAAGALIPPADMRTRVDGTDNEEWFHVSGRLSCEAFAAALRLAGRELSEFHWVLDFGCGVGRVLRWLRATMPHSQFTCADTDAEAIAWLGEHYTGIQLISLTKDGLPPIAVPDARFDLVLAYSVFTHLDVNYQDAWLAELRRVVMPDGMLLLTISGPRMLDHTLNKSGHGNVGDLAGRLPQFHADGVLHWRGEGWDRHFPDYYHTTFHSHGYVRDHWSRWFEVLGICADTSAEMPQDVVVLRARGALT